MGNTKNENLSIIVVSAINLFEGGTLSILKDCLAYLNASSYSKTYQILALVHKISVLDVELYPQISFMEFPKSRNSYFWRIYYEYYYFKLFFAEKSIKFWLSLHDITPNIGDVDQAVYCHNPSPFNKVNFKEMYLHPTYFFFSVFYKYIYQINIKKNKYVIVQQAWIKYKFAQMFNLDEEKIIVSYPSTPAMPSSFLKISKQNQIKTFFFPTYPRPFKNVELIGEAVKILLLKEIKNFKVIITLDGTENKYSKVIVEKYSSIKQIEFIGLVSRDKVFNLYAESDCLIFPSKLETWGLPISEFKQFGKEMLVADLPYAKETVGAYQKVKFFNPYDAVDLGFLMEQIISTNNLSYDMTENTIIEKPYANNWHELFDILIS